MSSVNSFAQSTSFRIFLPFLGEDFVFAQNIALPDFSLNPPPVNTAGKTLYVGGDHIEYSPLTIGFICDENFRLYKKLLTYITDRVHQNSGILEPLTEFTTGVEVTDSKGISLMSFYFYGCKIQSLGALNLVSNAEDVELNFDLSVLFDDWELVDSLDIDKLREQIIHS